MHDCCWWHKGSDRDMTISGIDQFDSGTVDTLPKVTVDHGQLFFPECKYWGLTSPVKPVTLDKVVSVGAGGRGRGLYSKAVKIGQIPLDFGEGFSDGE